MTNTLEAKAVSARLRLEQEARPWATTAAKVDGRPSRTDTQVAATNGIGKELHKHAERA